MFGQKDLGQVEPDLEASRQFRRRTLDVGGDEAEAGQNFLRLPKAVALCRGKAKGRLLEDGLGREHRLLFHIADAIILGNGYGPGIRRLQAGDDPKKGRLAVAVPAHQAHPFLPVDLEADVIKEGLGPKTLGQVLYGNHARRPPGGIDLGEASFSPLRTSLKAELLDDLAGLRKLLGDEKDIADVDTDRSL